MIFFPLEDFWFVKTKFLIIYTNSVVLCKVYTYIYIYIYIHTHTYVCVYTMWNNISENKVKVKSLSHVRLFATPWTVAYQAPLSMGFSKQEYWIDWIAISFSRRSSQPRDWTRVSHIVGRRFTVWATREVLYTIKYLKFSKEYIVDLSMIIFLPAIYIRKKA